MPSLMLNQIWHHFDFSWKLFVEVLQAYQSVFWIMLTGFIVHWLPDKVKAIWERTFTRMHMVFQTIAVAVIIILIYQAAAGTSKPFVYFQF
jgi:hypothetical protein